MKKAVWIFAVIAVTFVVDRGIGFLMQQQVANSQFRYARLYDNRAEADILLLGNSRGLIFYQPYMEEKTEKKTFNLSYNGLPIDLANVLVKDYYDLYPAPKKMLLDITMCDRLNDQLLAGFKTYSNYSNRITELVKEKMPHHYYGSQISHLFKFNSEIWQRNLFYQNKSDEDWLLDRVISSNMVENAQGLKPYTINFRPDSTDYVMDQLVELVKHAQQKGTTVELVINPYFPAFAASINNINELKSTVERRTGLQVSDYSNAIKDTNGFGDYQHLNKSGARSFIDLLIADKKL